MRRYEGMFLFDPAAGRDWSTTTGIIQRLMDRIQAKVEVCVKFDERKLAYELDKRKRGLFVLTYFQAEPEKITSLERDAQLDEQILRLLVLRPENVTDERIAELQAHPAEQPLVPLAPESRRDDGDRGDRRGDRDRDRRGGRRDDRRDRDREPAGVGAGRDDEGDRDDGDSD